ncbi:MAG: hypothetical protein ACJ731_02800 [Vicinamibacterales bacterium]
MSCFGRPAILPVAFMLCAAGISIPASAEDPKSAALAKELVQALDSAKLAAIATADPANAGVFVAALYIPGTQLLVVSAKYSAPPLLVDRITAKDYQAVYVDLQSASVHGTKIFVMDQGADGLVAKPSGDQPADSFDEGDKSVAFDGDWKKAKIPEAEYSKSFASADDRYAKMLSMLVAQLKKSKAGS